MEQLLSIKTIPLKYELEITRPHLEYTSKKSQLEMTRIDGGGYRMRSSKARLEMNTLEARNSVVPTTRTSIRQFANKGLEASMQYTAQSALEGKMLVNAKPGEDALGQVIQQRATQPTGEFQLGFIPTVGPDIQYVEPTLDVQYQADKLQFDVRVSKGDLEFIPGDVNMNITQWPDVIIEYLGKPLYVPPSANESPFLARA